MTTLSEPSFVDDPATIVGPSENISDGASEGNSEGKLDGKLEGKLDGYDDCTLRTFAAAPMGKYKQLATKLKITEVFIATFCSR
jgi:hypothetical protein